jgi:hypothetical protein
MATATPARCADLEITRGGEMRVMSLSAAVEVIESRIGCNDGFGSLD